MSGIGIVGGTFDPVHNGHLRLGGQAYAEYNLDEIWFMPSGQPPHKAGRAVTPAADRCAMVRLAVEGTEFFSLSEFETSRSGITYTARTLELLREEYPGHRFSFIIGADSLYQMESWYHPEQVLALAEILVADREYGSAQRSLDEQIRLLTGRYGGCIRRLHCPEFRISSEELRKMVRRGEPITGLVPAAVESYIEQKHLYCTGRNLNEHG